MSYTPSFITSTDLIITERPQHTPHRRLSNLRDIFMDIADRKTSLIAVLHTIEKRAGTGDWDVVRGVTRELVCDANGM